MISIILALGFSAVWVTSETQMSVNPQMLKKKKTYSLDILNLTNSRALFNRAGNMWVNLMLGSGEHLSVSPSM